MITSHTDIWDKSNAYFLAGASEYSTNIRLETIDTYPYDTYVCNYCKTPESTTFRVYRTLYTLRKVLSTVSTLGLIETKARFLIK